MACFQRRDQGNARHFDVADDEGRHVEGAVLDDDHRTVGLFEHKIVAVDLDVVDRDVGWKFHHIAGVGHVFVRSGRVSAAAFASAGASGLTGVPLPTSTGTGSAAAGAGLCAEACRDLDLRLRRLCRSCPECSSQELETVSKSLLVVIAKPLRHFPERDSDHLCFATIPQSVSYIRICLLRHFLRVVNLEPYNPIYMGLSLRSSGGLLTRLLGKQKYKFE